MRISAKILAAVAAFVILDGCGERPESGPAATGGHHPLIVIGVDGATWDVIDPMIAAGELPNFARLRQQGAWGPLVTVGPQVSPVVWTTIATGHFGRRHGILDFVYPYQPGPKRPVQSTERQVPALWNLATDAGRSIAVSGYFVTYPAEQVNGAIVTYNSPQKQDGADYPAEVLAPIRPELDSIFKAERKALWSRFLPWDFDPKSPPAEDDPTAEAFRMVSGRVERRILHAEYNRRASLHLARTPRDILVTYFALVDYASHSLWKYYDDSDFEQPADPESKRLLGDVLPESYRYIDEYLGELLATVPPDANVVVVSDHGFGSATGIFSVREERYKELLNGNHRPNGIFLASGPDIRPGRIDGMTIIDVFPTLAYLSGLPISDELPGDLNLDLFVPGRLANQPPDYVRSYGSQAAAAAKAAEESREAQEENVRALQGLGYVGESFELGDTETGTFDFWAAEDGLILSHLVGEFAFLVLKEDFEGARALLNEVRALRPDLPKDIVRRGRSSIQTIQDNIPAGAVPDSALAFLGEAQRTETAGD